MDSVSANRFLLAWAFVRWRKVAQALAIGHAGSPERSPDHNTRRRGREPTSGSNLTLGARA